MAKSNPSDVAQKEIRITSRAATEFFAEFGTLRSNQRKHKIRL